MSDCSQVSIAITGRKLVLENMVKALTPFFMADNPEIFSGFQWIPISKIHWFCAFYHPNMVWNAAAEEMWQSLTVYARKSRVTYVFYRMKDIFEVVTDYYNANFFHVLFTAGALRRIIKRAARLRAALNDYGQLPMMMSKS